MSKQITVIQQKQTSTSARDPRRDALDLAILALLVQRGEVNWVTFLMSMKGTTLEQKEQHAVVVQDKLTKLIRQLEAQRDKLPIIVDQAES